MPPFKRQGRQFDQAQNSATYEVASLRIHVERGIVRLKQFGILQFVEHHLYQHVDKIIHVLAYLCNNLPPLINEKRKKSTSQAPTAPLTPSAPLAPSNASLEPQPSTSRAATALAEAFERDDEDEEYDYDFMEFNDNGDINIVVDDDTPSEMKSLLEKPELSKRNIEDLLEHLDEFSDEDFATEGFEDESENESENDSNIEPENDSILQASKTTSKVVENKDTEESQGSNLRSKRSRKMPKKFADYET